MKKGKELLLLAAPKIDRLKNLLSWLAAFLLAIISFGLVLQGSWPTSPLNQALRSVQRWPQFPGSHYLLAQALTIHGQGELAHKELALGEKQQQFFQLFSLGRFFQSHQEAAKKQVNQKANLEAELVRLNQQLEVSPFSWQLLLEKAVIEYRLYQDSSAQQTADLALWLNPENSQVQEINKLVRVED